MELLSGQCGNDVQVHTQVLIRSILVVGYAVVVKLPALAAVYSSVVALTVPVNVQTISVDYGRL